MILTFLLLFAVLVPQDLRSNSAVPLRKLTPGSVLTTRRAIFCAPGYSASVRSVSKARRDSVYRRYGLEPSVKGYVLDHLIPLGLGGSNRITNLFPQDSAASYRKDRVEAWVRRDVCEHKRLVRPYQRAIARDWRALLDSVPAHFSPPRSGDFQ
jgi:hypothetical protein